MKPCVVTVHQNAWTGEWSISSMHVYEGNNTRCNCGKEYWGNDV